MLLLNCTRKAGAKSAPGRVAHAGLMDQRQKAGTVSPYYGKEVESMDFAQLIITAVGSVGFPIVIALLAAWYIKYLGDKNSETVRNMQEQILSLSEKQNNQLDKMSDAITEVQKTLAQLTVVIKGEITK